MTLSPSPVTLPHSSHLSLVTWLCLLVAEQGYAVSILSTLGLAWPSLDEAIGTPKP